ncbi:MAG: D-alanine--D-alanine ligase [Phycisphaerales bacterium]|nr:D-alanine--D-alanine ligase [Phycisphaerales bacterium]
MQRSPDDWSLAVSVTHSKTKPREHDATSTDRKLAITVLAGGPSGEREVSLESGQAVVAALETLGHEVQLEDIAPNDLTALAREVDCVFIALHGTFGEDGQVQSILEERGLCYCGSGPSACSLAMNKAEAKAKFADLGLKTPRFAVVTAETTGKITSADWPVPVVVKPIQEGSSLACHIVRDVAQFQPAVDAVVREYGRCMIEEYVPGREITVSILGDTALPPIEIRTRREFYDYEAKYVDEDTEFVFDIDLPQKLLEQISEMSLAAHRGLGCRDFSRVDWRVDDKRLSPGLLEVNVIPGLTSHSLFPKAAQHAGWSLPMMYQHLVELAMTRGL